MRRNPFAVVAVAFCVVLGMAAAPAMAGTQDFVLVNDTGIDMHYIYISETKNNDWEEDVLGEDILEDGSRLNMTFRGRTACLWDIKTIDEDGDSLEWSAINLCEVSVVVLTCNRKECWAEFE